MVPQQPQIPVSQQPQHQPQQLALPQHQLSVQPRLPKPNVTGIGNTKEKTHLKDFKF